MSKKIFLTIYFVVILIAGLKNFVEAGEIIGEVISVGPKDPISTNMSLGGLTVGLDSKGIVFGNDNVRSWWQNISSNGMAYPDYNTEIKGNFEDVTFSVYRDDKGRYIYSVIMGHGLLKNESDKIIAQGDIEDSSDWIAIAARKGATFKYKPQRAKVETKWGNEIPSEFAIVTLRNNDEWVIENDNFKFLMEVYSLSSPTLFVLIPDSIVHASIINLPSGNFDLFGYKIIATENGAKVKFQHGIASECSKCSIQEIAIQKIDLDEDNKTSIGADSPVYGKRSSDSIKEVVSAQRGSIDFLFKKALRSNPTLKGTMVVEFTIAENGDVTGGRIVSSTIKEPSFEDQVLKRILTWKFPPQSNSGNTVVFYPVEFSSM